MQLVIRKVVKTDKTQDNASHARALLEYITKPDQSPAPDDGASATELKCVWYKAFNAAAGSDDVAGIVEEMQTLSKTCKYESSALINSHWVLSWKPDDDEPAPSPEEMEAAGHELLADLGYTSAHVYAMAAHGDTDQPHLHIVASRASKADGLILREGGGWWQREAQQSLARICHLHGWRQPEGAKYLATGESETITTPDPWLEGREITRDRPKVAPAPAPEQDQPQTPAEAAEAERQAGPQPGKGRTKAQKKRPLRSGNDQSERRTGYLSMQSLLDRQIRFAFAELEARPAGRWKWGEIYSTLARYGVEVAVQQHGSREGLAYTVDGLKWYTAAEMGGTEYGLDRLTEMAGGRRIRQPREQVHGMAEEVRKTLITSRPAPQEESRFTPEEVEKVRRIPMTAVAMTFKIPDGWQKDARVKNSIDLMRYYAGREYQDAVKDLQVAFRPQNDNRPRGPQPGLPWELRLKEIIAEVEAEDAALAKAQAQESQEEDPADDGQDQDRVLTRAEMAQKEREDGPRPVTENPKPKPKEKPTKPKPWPKKNQDDKPPAPPAPEPVQEVEEYVEDLEPRRLWDASALKHIRDMIDQGIDQQFPGGLMYDDRFALEVAAIVEWEPATAEEKAEAIARAAMELVGLDESEALRLMADKCGHLPAPILHQLDRWQDQDGHSLSNPPGEETDISRMTPAQAAMFERQHPEMQQQRQSHQQTGRK